MNRQVQIAGLVGLCGGLWACGEGETPPGSLVVPDTYGFESRFAAGSSVDYSGQAHRNVLIADLTSHIESLTARLDQGTLTPTVGDVRRELMFFYAFDGATSNDVAISLATEPPALQVRYADLAAGKSLEEKMAGNDPVGQHRDWSTAFVGWSGASSPEALLLSWFDTLDAQALARAAGDIPLDPYGDPIDDVQITQDGLHLGELVQKLLLGAVAFSQGADDYLDDDLEGKGLRSDNTEQDSGASYTALEHGWDEGFGYFGAAQDLLAYTEEEAAGRGGREGWARGHHDTNGDGRIDLKSERNFDLARYAARRDLGSAASAKTEFTKEAMKGFLTGRSIIAAATGPLSEAQRADLTAARDRAVGAWEAAIAATAIHYLNSVLADMAKFGTPDYSFGAHAGHWSEMKAFALALQFNPRSPVSDVQFAAIHDRMRDKPALPGHSDVAHYAAGLREVKGILQTAYGFDPANVGDDDGNGGW